MCLGSPTLRGDAWILSFVNHLSRLLCTLHSWSVVPLHGLTSCETQVYGLHVSFESRLWGIRSLFTAKKIMKIIFTARINATLVVKVVAQTHDAVASLLCGDR